MRWVYAISLAACVTIGTATSHGEASLSTEPNQLDHHRAIIEQVPAACRIGATLDLPVELIVGVILAEQELNVHNTDRIQDALGHALLAIHEDEEWWEAWAERSEGAATRALGQRAYSNKWPVSLLATGYVSSLGFGQITPRTALAACRQIKTRADACTGGVRRIVSGLLDPARSIELTAAVLRFEADTHFAVTGHRTEDNVAMMATLYNVGGEYFRRSARHREGDVVNDFGRWVNRHLAEIRVHARCAPMSR